MARRRKVSATPESEEETNSLIGHVRCSANIIRGPHLALEMSPLHSPTTEYGPKTRDAYRELFITLHQAARNGDDKLCELVLKSFSQETLKARIDELDDVQLAPLHYAARYNHYNVVQLLLHWGADVMIKGDNRIQPLHLAARYKSAIPIPDITEGDILKTPKDTVISLLLDCGAYINCRDAFGMTPLHFAAMRGNVQVVQELLAHPLIDPEARDKQSMTPLHLAAAYNHPAVAGWLLATNRVNTKARDEDLATPLHRSALSGATIVVQHLLEFTEIIEGNYSLIELLSMKDKHENLALHCAVEMGHLDIVKLLLSKAQHTQVNEPRVDYIYPLHIAARSGHVEVVRVLLDHGANSACLTVGQDTPLHLAAAFDHGPVITLLLERGAELEARNNNHLTPMLVAAMEGHCDALKTLIDHEASLEYLDKSDQSAIFLAAQENHPQALALLLDTEVGQKMVDKSNRYENRPIHVAAMNGFHTIVKILLEHNAEMDGQNDEEETPLHLAAKNGRYNILDLLLGDRRCMVNAEEEFGNTALHLAATAGHQRVVRKLLNAGADVKARNNILWTPLDCAASSGWIKTARILLKAGSPVDPIDKAKTTPLHLASARGHAELVELLLKSGACPTLLDDRGFNCLDYAIENNYEGVALTVLNCPRWQDILRHQSSDAFYETPLRKLIDKMPDIASIVLDKLVTYSNHQHYDADLSITYNFEYLDDSFVPSPKKPSSLKLECFPEFPLYGEDNHLLPDTQLYTENQDHLKKNHPLMLMVSCRRQELLSHPLCTRLLDHKWKYFGRYVYYGNLGLFLVFLAFLTCYVLSATPPCTTSSDTCCPTVPHCPERFGSCAQDDRQSAEVANVSKYFIIVLTVIHLVKELFQLYQNRWRYLTIENFVEWCCYISALLFVSDFEECSFLTGIRTVWQWELGAYAIFLAWLVLVMFISKFPFLGIYVVMVMDVLQTFAHFFLVFCLFIVAFSLGFFMLLHNQAPFEGPMESLVKTSVMMIGEMEYDAIFNEETPVLHRGATYLLFVVFLILMSIIVMNLLVGLAVDDIKAVQEQAQLKRLAMTVDLVLSVEGILPTFLRRKCIVRSKTIWPNRPSQFFSLLQKFWTFDENAFTSPFAKSDLTSAAKSQQDICSQLCDLRAKTDLITRQNKRLTSLLSALYEREGLRSECSHEDD